MQFKRYDWLDVKNVKPIFGIQVRESNKDTWHHLSMNGKPVLYETEEERDKKLKELRKQNKNGEFNNCDRRYICQKEQNK